MTFSKELLAAIAVLNALSTATWEDLHRIFQVAVDPEAELVTDKNGNQHIESEIVPIEQEE